MCTLQDTTNMSPEQIQAMVDAINAANGQDPAGYENPNKTGIAGGGDRGMLPTALAEGLNPETGYNDGIPRNPDGSVQKPLEAGQTSGNTGFDPKTYLNANPDVLAEYNRVVAVGDRNSPFFSEHGLESPETFAAWHYNTYGKNENRPGAGGSNVGATGGAVSQGNDLITSLTQGFNDQIKTLSDQNATLITQLQNSNTATQAQIGALTKAFQTNQQQLLDQMNMSAAKQSAEFSKALKDMRDATNSTGQAAKKPDYRRALAKNRELNSMGLSSTMLTGSRGVNSSSMTLGATSLLGA